MGRTLLSYYKNKVNFESKLAFWFTFVVGILIHIFKFTNYLPNPDSLDEVYASQNIIGSGRWLLSIACGFSSYFNLPWITGLFSIFFLSLSVVFIVAIFSIKNPFIIALTGGLLVSFPGTTETFFYQYTADGYMIAMLLSSISVWVMCTKIGTPPRSKLTNCAASILCICCTCAIYQTYVSFSLILALLYLMHELLKNQYTFREILKWAVFQIVCYALGLILYYVIWKLLLIVQNNQVTNYLGISTLGLDFANIVHNLINSYRIILWNFIGGNLHDHGFHLNEIVSNGYQLTVYAVLNIIFLLCFLYALIYSIYKSGLYKRKLELLFFIGSIVLIPPVSCIWLFTSGTLVYRYSTMMLHAICLLYIFSAVLYEKYFTCKVKNAIALLLVTIILNNALLANISYYYFNKMYYASFATSSEVVYRIDMLGADTKQIAFVGTPQNEADVLNEYSVKIAPLNFTPIDNYGYSIHFINETFCREFISVDNEWYTDERNQMIEGMSSWPTMDSLKVIDDVIVVKLS